jgi:hypothetical protein
MGMDDPNRHLESVVDLSDSDREMIRGGNAARLLNLEVTRG